jgi:hypothetical protein
MAIEEYKPLEDKEVVKIVEDNISRSIGYYDSELSVEREKVTEYYNAALPKATHDGNSKYISQDVYDAVNSMKAALLETFSAGRRIVAFAPQNADDVETAKVCSEYTDYVMFRQNDAYQVMADVIHDGLVARCGIAKVYWDQRTEYEPREFERLTQDELDMLLSEDGVELEDSETDEIGLITGMVSVEVDKSQVVIESMSPESFIVEPQASNLDNINFCAHRERKTITELREMGYSEELIDSIGDDHSDVELETDPEMLARHDDIGADRGFNAKGYQDQVRSVMVYECYIMLDPDATGYARLHKVCKAGNALLDMYEIDRMPFCVFTPLPIPHAFYGANFADKLIPTQNARSVLTRSILDHAVITNNPRYMVTKGGLTNPRELSNNKIGGLVNVTRADAIAPLPQASLNPFVFQTLQLLEDDAEDTSGISSLSKGLNKDAVSKQNSGAMIEQLATMSQQRQKIIARNFSNQFLKPLFHEVYRLVVENEDQTKVVELAGNYVEVQPSSWEDKRDVVVEIKLGYGEQEREAAKYLAVHQLFSQDPTLQPFYTPENRYKLMKAVLEKQDILNVDDYITRPDQLPPPQPDPAQQMQQEMAMKQMEINERQTAVAELKAQTEAQIAAMKLELEQLKAQAQHALQSDSMDLKEAQFAHKQFIDEGELEILKTTEDKRGIVSPTG